MTPNPAPVYEPAMSREELLAEHERGVKMLQELCINRLADLISPWAFSPAERFGRSAARMQKPSVVVK